MAARAPEQHGGRAKAGDGCLQQAEARTPGRPLSELLLEAGAIRFKPIHLTALATMIGAAVILFDTIFQRLAIPPLFGLIFSTVLTVLVILANDSALKDDGQPMVAPRPRPANETP